MHDLDAIRADMLALESRYATAIDLAHPLQQKSARNLLHYLALRRHDIRHVQERLAPLGLSSLGRSESHVLATVQAVRQALAALCDRTPPDDHAPVPVTFTDGAALLDQHARALFKAVPEHRTGRIMVTMPSTAASDVALVHDLLAAGMDIMRINCAHDDPAVWEAMIARLRQAEQELGRRAYVLMDLAGPKVRTGPIEPGPAVIKWRPRRDDLGRVIAPARVWLAPSHSGDVIPAQADASLSVDGAWLAQLRKGSTIALRDARGAGRSLRVVAAQGTCWWAECDRTAYITPGMRLRDTERRRDGGADCDTMVGFVPRKAQTIPLRRGETLILTRDLHPGRPAVRDAEGQVVIPARIGCTLPAIFSEVRPGEHVWLDDGKIDGVIRAVSLDEMRIEITRARVKGERLGADKGINLPDSVLRLPALTEQDLATLPFVATHADMIGYSFVRSADDVVALQRHLADAGAERLGIVLKIETRAAVNKLPELLLAVMRSPAAGVMIARGDLAVECGYERLAELQEEILCFAEAAHMPVIWATQVLEGLAQDGVPSRAEISDAAMGERAECVMLNKGPYIVEAVYALDNILRRMQDHQSKKSAMLRQLRLARNFWPRG